MNMMRAAYCHKLEPLPLLSAKWHYRLLERSWQIFFGEVFDKRVGMLFAARRNEDGNVHRRDGVSKTVTKNMRVGFFFKNPKTKERPKEAPFRGKNITADTAERSFPDLILKGISGFLSVFFPRFALLFIIDIDFSMVFMSSQPKAVRLPLKQADTFAIGLTPPSIPPPDEGVETPSTADVWTTCFDVRLLAVPILILDASVQVLATKGRYVDADDGLMKKTFKQLITNGYC